jgi:hypothetical protein
MSDPAAFRHRLWLGVALALTALKLWLSRGQGIFAIGGAGYDDRLFLELAQHLVRGEWLGPYNELTLAKGPFYSLFIAAAFTVGLPLFLAQQLFYAAACALFTRALRPAVTASGARLGIYLLLLWNPMTFDAPSMGRVLRQHVYGPLGLLIFAGLIALYLRRTAAPRAQLPWALLLGLAGAAFYLTREESVWFVPGVLLLAGACLAGAWQISRFTFRRSGIMLGLALVVASIPVLLVCARNQRHYGWFGTSEFRAGPFMDAYGAMLRVQVGPEIRFVPVTREAREAMAAVSPAFAAVQAELSRDIARNWSGASAELTGLPADQEQVGGGWMVWAFREATFRAGPHGTARQVMSRYRQIAREINAACDDGRLPAGPARSGFVPPWREWQTDPFVHAAGDFADFVVRFSRFSARPLPSTGSLEELVLFRDLTGERLSPREGELDVVGAAEYLLNVWKVGVLQQTGKALRPVLLSLFLLAQVLVLVRVAQAAWRRQWTFPLTVAAAAWGTCAASILLHAMIHATSYPVLTISSFAPVYPLLLVFIVAVLWDALTAWPLPWRRSAQTSSSAVPAPAPQPVTPAPPAVPLTAWQRALPWLAGVAALLPFLAWQREFRELFWFGDDYLLLDQMAVMSPWEWVTRVFAENFVPLFKLFWSGAVFGFDGSYRAMLWLLWLTHAANTLLFGRLLQRAGFPWLATLITQLCFALTAANLETLGWATQWSAVLATGFLLLALNWHERHAGHPPGFSWRYHLPLFLLAAASACSFSRGVMTGAMLAGGLLLPFFATRDRSVLVRNLPGVLLCLLPAVTVALLIKLNSTGNHQQMSGHWADILTFGAGYFLLNPGHLVLGETSLHPLVLLVIAAAKLGAIAAGLWFSRGRVRHLLLLLLAYDLGSAVLVGIGRFHTGFLASMSSRYQYSSLLATLPFVALLLALALERVPRGRARLGAQVALVAVLVGGCLWSWPAELKTFTGWRGTELRRLIAAPATNDPEARVPALEFMHIERAKALQRAYNLH